jgi:signal transduction histidine kinase
MKAEATGPGSGRTKTAQARWEVLMDPIRRVPQRIRERRFWEVQALVFVATVPHYAIEILGYTNPFETSHGLAITLYILPLLYASLSYGWEGAILTAIWGAALTSPSLWIWHRSESHWLTELGQLAITLPVGVLVAWRVDREAKERVRAEKTSADLKLLNEVAEILSHTLEVEQELPAVVRRLLSGLSLDAVWLCLEPESGADSALVIIDSYAAGVSPIRELAQELHRGLMSAPEEVVTEGGMVAVPLLGETQAMGSLGVRTAGNAEVGADLVDLLTTIARQMQVALENSMLYRQRQESLQSYVRQVTEAQEEERLRIARELHDETAQELVHLARKLEQLRSGADPGQTDAIQELVSMTRGTIQAVRRFSRDLRPSVLDDLGLRAAIEMVVEDAGNNLPRGVRLTVTGRERRLDGPLELALFRIAQEALRNVEKHSAATMASVDLDFGGDEITLSVTDNGRGLASAKIADLIRSGKLGIAGMKERAELVGGALDLQSINGEGTRVVVTVRNGGSAQDARQGRPPTGPHRG